MSLNAFATATLVFLVLYTLLFTYLVWSYATGRFKWRSRWTLLLFHVTIRLAAQAVGLGFGIKGYDATDLLVAFLILSAEGYFTLVLCTLRLLISWHRRHLPSGESWLEPREKEGKCASRRILEAFLFTNAFRCPVQAIHWVLVNGNVLIIVGGTMLAGGTKNVTESWSVNSDKLIVSKALRGAGQTLFLLVTLFVHANIARNLLYDIHNGKGRTILLLLLATLPLMLIRGVFGICQAVVNSLNYYYPGIYTDSGFTDDFVIKETVFAAAMEWSTCAILLSTSLLRSPRDKRKGACGTALKEGSTKGSKEEDIAEEGEEA